MGYPIFKEFSPLIQGGFNPLIPNSWSSRLLGLREGSYGQFNPNTTPSVIQTPQMRGNRQSQNLVWQGSYWQPHYLQEQPPPPGGFDIDPRVGPATTRLPVAFRDDSHPQTILKLQHHNSLKSRVFYMTQLKVLNYCTRANKGRGFYSKITFLAMHNGTFW